jgi:hypothetical protein
MLLLITCSCALAGQVKTFDGSKVDKDSTATLKVYGEDGMVNHRTLIVFVSSVDTLRLIDRAFPGEDHSGAGQSDAAKIIQDPFADASAAKRIRGIKLPCRRCTLMTRAIVSEGRIRTANFEFSPRLSLEFSPNAGREYEIRGKFEAEKWTIWIQDRKTKEVVSTATEVI